MSLAQAPNDMLLQPFGRNGEPLGLKQCDLRILETGEWLAVEDVQIGWDHLFWQHGHAKTRSHGCPTAVVPSLQTKKDAPVCGVERAAARLLG